ncbi:hypothetical protein REPUB_Repub01dG0136400 [Reevesia pubescens]
MHYYDIGILDMRSRGKQSQRPSLNHGQYIVQIGCTDCAFKHGIYIYLVIQISCQHANGVHASNSWQHWKRIGGNHQSAYI